MRTLLNIDVSRVAAGCFVAATLTLFSVSCNGRGPVLPQQVRAQELVVDLRIQFGKAADQANQAVMADTDALSLEAAGEARRAREAVESDMRALQPILKELGNSDVLKSFDDFTQRFSEYKTLDDTILELAVENTNLKAQRLSFGQGQDAVNAFRASLRDVARAASPKDADKAEARVARAEAAVLEIQVIQARHIPESEDAAMTTMEAQIATSEAAARSELEALKRMGPSIAPAIAKAFAALDRFHATGNEILALSRRNTHVRSLALALGQKRTVAAGCDELLQQLEYELAKLEFRPTR